MAPTRQLTALPERTALADALAAVDAALEGRGPAVLPLPADPAAGARLTRALRPDDPAHPADADDLAAVVGTSGSTGPPKGALLTAYALRASATATHVRLGGPGRWLLALPVSHVAGLQVLVRSLLAGTVPEQLTPGSPFRVGDFTAATARLAADPAAPRRYTALVPTQLTRLLDAGADLTAYDAVLVGGASTAPALLARARAVGVRVVRTYGMSETSGGCVYDGVALDGVEVALGPDGRIRLRGAPLFSGYRLRPDLGAEALVDGWHLTQDLGHVDGDGILHVLGRLDDVVVTGGVNVAAPLVAATLLEHPLVAAADVHGRPDPEWGQRVTAVVVARDPDRPPSLAELRAWVGARLGSFCAPRALTVVPVLPLLASGKPDRAALARLPVTRWGP